MREAQERHEPPKPEFRREVEAMLASLPEVPPNPKKVADDPELHELRNIRLGLEMVVQTVDLRPSALADQQFLERVASLRQRTERFLQHFHQPETEAE